MAAVEGLAPAPPGLDLIADESPDVREDILKRIGEKVVQLLEAAKKDSEAKVKAEMKGVNDIMRDMDLRIDAIIRNLDQIEQDQGPEEAVEPQTVAQALAKLEQQWGKELGKLKQELHQTIYAHNHNADLMKHQKDALDGISGQLDARKTGVQDVERVKLAKAQLANADGLLKGQLRQRKLEPLFRRLEIVEQKITAWRWPMGMMPGMAHPGMGMPGGLPGMGMPGMPPGMGGMPPGMLPGMAAAWGGPRGIMAGQAAALAARSATAAAMAHAAAERGGYAGAFPSAGARKRGETSEDDEEVEMSRPPGLL